MTTPAARPRSACGLAGSVALAAAAVIAAATGAGALGAQQADTTPARRDVTTALRHLDVAFYLFALHRYDLPRDAAEFSFTCGTTVYGICLDRRDGSISPGGRFSLPGSAMYARENLPGRNLRDPIHKRVNEANEKIARAQRKAPADGWITERRVWLLLEAGRHVPALHATMFCRAAEWHCLLLEGWVEYARDSLARSDSVFMRALPRMPAAERCSWTDLSLLLDGRRAREFARMDCAGQVAYEERFWWLSDPLWSEPGNERRAAHYGRRMALRNPGGVRKLMETLHKAIGPAGGPIPASVNPDMIVSLPSGNGYDEITLLFGPPSAYYIGQTVVEQTREVLAQYGWPRQAFVPALEALDDPFAARPGDWQLDATDVREHMTTTRNFSALDHQSGFFRRGDSARFVISSDASRDTLLLAGFRRAALVLSTGPDDLRMVARDSGLTQFTFAVDVKPEPFVVAVEMSSTPRTVGRTRFGTRPPEMPEQRVTISDMLLLEVNGEEVPPVTLEGAMQSMLGRSRVDSGGSAVLFWELYGMQQGEVPSMSLSVLREFDGLTGVARRVTRRPLTETSVRLAWDDRQSSGRTVEARTITVDLASLEPGRYMLRLVAEVPGQGPVQVERPFTVVKR